MKPSVISFSFLVLAACASQEAPIQLDDIRDPGEALPGVAKVIECDPAPKYIYDKRGEIVETVHPILHPSCSKGDTATAFPFPGIGQRLGRNFKVTERDSNASTLATNQPSSGAQPPSPAAPTDPAVPSDPVVPNDPAAPSTPTNPGTPTNPTDPTTPTIPGGGDPSTPNNPSNPVDPTVPTNPATPSNPNDPNDDDHDDEDHHDDEGCSDPDPCHDHPDHNPATNDSLEEIEKYHPELQGN